MAGSTRRWRKTPWNSFARKPAFNLHTARASMGIEVLLAALHSDAEDVTCWLALADALAEGGESERGELMRLVTLLRTGQREGSREQSEERVRELLASGVKPCMPEMVNSL